MRLFWWCFTMNDEKVNWKSKESLSNCISNLARRLWELIKCPNKVPQRWLSLKLKSTFSNRKISFTGYQNNNYYAKQCFHILGKVISCNPTGVKRTRISFFAYKRLWPRLIASISTWNWLYEIILWFTIMVAKLQLLNEDTDTST